MASFSLHVSPPDPLEQRRALAALAAPYPMVEVPFFLLHPREPTKSSGAAAGVNGSPSHVEPATSGHGVDPSSNDTDRPLVAAGAWIQPPVAAGAPMRIRPPAAAKAFPETGSALGQEVGSVSGLVFLYFKSIFAGGSKLPPAKRMINYMFCWRRT